MIISDEESQITSQTSSVPETEPVMNKAFSQIHFSCSSLPPELGISQSEQYETKSSGEMNNTKDNRKRRKTNTQSSLVSVSQTSEKTTTQRNVYDIRSELISNNNDNNSIPSSTETTM